MLVQCFYTPFMIWNPFKRTASGIRANSIPLCALSATANVRKMRVLIVEDEFITQQLLQDALAEFGYEVSGTAMSADAALEVLERNDTDLAILDINIKGARTGIWVAEQIRERFHIPFLFLTAYVDESTMQTAIGTEPEAYLVKPFKDPELKAAIDVAMAKFRKQQPAKEAEASEDSPISIRDSLFVKDKYMYVKLKVSDILHIQSDGNYLHIATRAKRHMVRSSLKDFVRSLPPEAFAQVHRRWVVNVDAIDGFSASNLQVGEDEIPLAPTYREDIASRFRTL